MRVIVYWSELITVFLSWTCRKYLMFSCTLLENKEIVILCDDSASCRTSERKLWLEAANIFPGKSRQNSPRWQWGKRQWNGTYFTVLKTLTVTKTVTHMCWKTIAKNHYENWVAFRQCKPPSWLDRGRKRDFVSSSKAYSKKFVKFIHKILSNPASDK